MASETDHPAKGRILAVRDEFVIFNPAGSTYELHLKTQGAYDGPIDEPIEGIIRVNARKVWTVRGGGNFVEPITGRPRIVQGRVRQLSDQQLIVIAAAPIVVNLPADDMAFDLSRGPIGVGTMVNVTCLPGGSFEFLRQAVAK